VFIAASQLRQLTVSLGTGAPHCGQVDISFFLLRSRGNGVILISFLWTKKHCRLLYARFWWKRSIWIQKTSFDNILSELRVFAAKNKSSVKQNPHSNPMGTPMKIALTKKTALVSVIVLLVFLNFSIFYFAYPQTFKPEAPTLARDFSAYYIGEWRLFHNPTQVYSQHSAGRLPDSASAAAL